MASNDYINGSPLTGVHDAITSAQESRAKQAKEAKEKSKSDKKPESTNVSGSYTKPSGYLANGSGLPENTQYNLGDDTAVFDGKANRSLVRETGIQVPRNFQVFMATFHTQDGDINANYSLGRKDIEYAVQEQYSVHFNNELLGFTTKNDNQADMPTMTIRLSGMRSWSRVILPNDYVSITVTAWGDAYDKPVTSVLMTGLVSEIHQLDEPQSNSDTYMVTCQSVAKFMSNVTLTTFTELSANGGFLLQDSSGTAEVDTGSTNTDEDSEDNAGSDSDDNS